MADTYLVERSTTIHAPAELIFAYIADFHRWTAWSPWEGLDPEMRRTYSGPDSGPGATYAWAGNRKAGEGRMEGTNQVEPSRLTSMDKMIGPDFEKGLERLRAVAEGPASTN